MIMDYKQVSLRCWKKMSDPTTVLKLTASSWWHEAVPHAVHPHAPSWSWGQSWQENEGRGLWRKRGFRRRGVGSPPPQLSPLPPTHTRPHCSLHAGAHVHKLTSLSSISLYLSFLLVRSHFSLPSLTPIGQIPKVGITWSKNRNMFKFFMAALNCFSKML